MRQPFAILALDQARSSGVCMGELGTAPKPVRVLSGVATTTPVQQEMLARAVALAGGDPKRLAVIYEDHSKIPAAKAGNTATILGMGDARGGWRVLCDLAGIPKVNRFKVTMDDWRRQVLPERGRADRDEWKERAIRWARLKYGGVDLSSDAAEAAAILEWSVITRPWLAVA